MNCNEEDQRDCDYEVRVQSITPKHQVGSSLVDQILDKFELGQILRQPVIRSHPRRADTNSMFSGELLDRNAFSFYKRDVSQIDDCCFGTLAGILARK